MKKLISLMLVLATIMSLIHIATPVSADEEEQNTVTAQANAFANVPFSNGYHGFCLNADLHAPVSGQQYTISPNTSAAKNHVDNTDVSQLIKILFTQCFEEIFVKTEQGYVISNDYSSIPDYSYNYHSPSIVQNLIYYYVGNNIYHGGSIGGRWDKIVQEYTGPDIPDSGFQKTLENGDVVTFYFMVMLSGNDTSQDMFAYKVEVEPKTIDVSVKKVWDDANNQDGKRPESLTVTLSNGTEVTLNESNNWTATVTDLPKYANGSEIIYTWTEGEMPQGYTLTDTKVEGTATTLTNSYTPEEIDVTVKKIWDDANNQDGKRPESLTVTLSNGTEVTLNESNNWTATVTDLPKYANGSEIIYTWTEGEMPQGYTLTDTKVEGTVTTLTNSYTPEEIDVTVKKIWDDANNQDGKRPESLNVTLSNGTEVTLNESNNWTATVTDLPKYANGSEIIYTWTEGEMPQGYTLTDTKVEGTVTTITNSYTPETVSATIKKIWNDADNQDGKRPESLKVTLSNGTEVTLNEQNGWTATVPNLPKYNNGQAIQYTWTEGSMPEGYKLTDTSVAGTVTTLTNSYTPEKVSATIRKVWDDANNQDGKRPESLTVTLSDGTEVELKESNNWTATVEELPKYDKGQVIEYTWTENAMPEGYALTGTDRDGYVTTLTNSYTPETVSATIKKVWDDANNQDGKRPENLAVTLSNGMEVILNKENSWMVTVPNLPKYDKGQVIEYTWTESAMPEGYALTGTDRDGYVTTLTNSHTPEKVSATIKKVWDDAKNQDGKRPESLTVTLSDGTEVELKESNNWTATVKDLPKYNNGQVIEYTWIEGEMPEGYTLTGTAKDGYVTTLTNSHTPETVSATIKKVWNDADNQDGKRPESLTVTLSDGTEVELKESNNWTATVEDLPKYNNGQVIEYTWTESAMPEGYTLTGTVKEGYVTTLTNSHTPEKVSATIKKVWDDAENQDGKRPESLNVTLSNGTEVTLNETNDWTVTVTDLPKYANGSEIIYTWTEGKMPEGYTLTDTDVEGTVTTLTNSYTPETVSATIKKVWDDADNQDGKRPESLTVTLSDGTEVTLNEENDWTATVSDLPKFDNGQVIEYTWTEGSMPEGYTLTDTSVEGTVTTLTNSYTPEEINVTVKKIWDDTGKQNGSRPASILVKLFADGHDTGKTLVLSEENSWTGAFTGLNAKAAGVDIVYTVDEADIPAGYEKAIGDAVETNTGIEITITNTLKDEPKPDDKEDHDKGDQEDNDQDGNNKEEDKPTEETGSSEDSKPSDNTNSKSPLTGDNSGLFQWIVLLAISIFGVGVLWKKRASVK